MLTWAAVFSYKILQTTIMTPQGRRVRSSLWVCHGLNKLEPMLYKDAYTCTIHWSDKVLERKDLPHTAAILPPLFPIYTYIDKLSCKVWLFSSSGAREISYTFLMWNSKSLSWPHLNPKGFTWFFMQISTLLMQWFFRKFSIHIHYF